MVGPRPSPKVSNWLTSIAERSLYLSVLTIGELEKGVALVPDGPRRAALQAWVRVELPARFAGRMLPFDVRVATRWGRMIGEAQTRQISLPVIDSQIAATALENGLIVVTRNVRDFVRCGVDVLDPWDEA